MGLDMYLYRVNKKINDEKELDNALRKFKRAPEKAELEAYELFKQNKPVKAISILKPWNKINLDEFIYNEESGEIQYGKRGITLTNYFERISEDIKDVYNSNFFNKINEYLETENKDDVYIDNEDVYYWRKHPDLHGYMEDLYYKKGGEDQVFNCSRLILDKEDVEELLEKIKRQVAGSNEFETTEGFFFGETDDEYWKEDVEVFEKLLKETDWDKETVYYSSWW